MREIYPKRETRWWQSGLRGDRLEEAASHVCASYDILARMIEFDKLERWLPIGGYGRFFKRFWAGSIFRTHEALGGFLEHRREVMPDAYKGYTRLAKAAGTYVDNKGAFAPN